MKKYLIVGQGPAGMAAARELKQLEREAAVTVISEENQDFYNKVDLPDIVSSLLAPQDAVLQSASELRELGIITLQGEKVVQIIPERRCLRFFSGKELHYDKLLLAPGSKSIRLNLPGMKAVGVYDLWTMEQAKQLFLAAAAAPTAVVVGAGLIGLKTALALASRGLKVTVLERKNRILSEQLDETAAAVLAKAIVGEKVKIVTEAEVERIEEKDGRVCGVWASGRLFSCKIVVCAVGVSPNVQFAKSAGITLNKGILTDSYLRTSDPDIYAAGDAAEVTNIYGTGHQVSAGWPAAVEQGICAARNMSEVVRERYDGYLAKNSVELAGISLVSVGSVQAREKDQVMIWENGNQYSKLVFHEKRLSGFLLLGDIRQAGVLTGAVIRQNEFAVPFSGDQTINYINLWDF